MGTEKNNSVSIISPSKTRSASVLTGRKSSLVVESIDKCLLVNLNREESCSNAGREGNAAHKKSSEGWHGRGKV